MNAADVGEVLRRLRRRRGMTQAELGERVGLSAGTISRYERGLRAIRWDTAEEAVEALGYPFLEFLRSVEELAEGSSGTVGSPGGRGGGATP